MVDAPATSETVGQHRASSRPPAELRRDLPSLTGLRWFAAAGVFGVHIAVASGPLAHLLEVGTAGVSFFYVLSGFVLTWALRPGDTAPRFYLRRFARVYPSHLAVWLLILPLVSINLYDYDRRPFSLGAFLLQAWSPHASDFWGGNGVAWSLSCEAFFYLCFPVLIRLLRPLATRGLVAAGVLAFAVMATVDLAATLAPRATAASNERWTWLALIFPPVRFMDFVIGCVTALLVQRARRCPVPAWLAVIVAGIAYVGVTATPQSDVRMATWITVLPFALVIASFASLDIERKRSWVAARWLVLLGQWSFAFYLVHQPVIRLVRYYLIPHHYLPFHDRHLYTDATSLILAVLVAALLHYIIERPFERNIRRFALPKAPPRIAAPVG